MKRIQNKKYSRKQRNMMRILAVLAMLVIIIVIFWRYLPYENTATKKIKSLLESKGIKVSSLKLEYLNNSEASISKIKLGDDPSLNINDLKIKYSLQKLLRGQLNSVETKDIAVNIYQKDGKFLIGGLEDILQKPSGNTDSKTKIPSDKVSLQNLLPEKITVNNINISGKAAEWEFNLPLGIFYDLYPDTKLNIDSTGFNFTAKPYSIATENISLQAILNDKSKKWQGEITIPSIKISGSPSELPPLSAKIDFSATSENLTANINFHDAENKTKSDIELSLPIANPAKGNLKIKELQFPWGGGLIYVESVNISLGMEKPIFVTLNLKDVDLSDTLGQVSDGKIKGTGKISGTIPIIYNPDGTIELQDGTAQASNDGMISVSPTLLPGENSQLEFARTTLQNFHYTKLKISVSSKGDRSAINLALEGKNPDSTEERPINFNINLTGDILPLIQQSIIPFNDIKKLLQHDNKQEK